MMTPWTAVWLAALGVSILCCSPSIMPRGLHGPVAYSRWINKATTTPRSGMGSTKDPPRPLRRLGRIGVGGVSDHPAGDGADKESGNGGGEHGRPQPATRL